MLIKLFALAGLLAYSAASLAAPPPAKPADAPKDTRAAAGQPHPDFMAINLATRMLG